MKFLPGSACFFLIASTLVPRAAAAQSQHEMNAAAAAEFAKADKELNEVYAKVLGVLDDGSKEKLKKSQRAWVAYRDAEADFSADAEARGGSMWPMIHEGTRARLTQERVKSLRELLIGDGE
jgi:uncharacterized protein YecT (DUF1311 family)